MFEYKFPDIGEGITEGTLIKWLVDIGDEVKEGQDLAEIETDKMTTTIPSAATGKVHELHVEEHGTLEVGKVFISIDDGTKGAAPKETLEDTPAPAAEKEEKPSVKEESKDINGEPERKTDEEAGVVGTLISSQEELPPSTEGTSTEKKAPVKKKVLATPVARKLAKDLQVDIHEIEGTGPGGRVMKEDIHKFADSKKAMKEEPLPIKSEEKIAHEQGERREPITRIRKTISQRMSESKNHLVHTTSMEEIDVSALVAFRERMKEVVGEDVKLTYLPFIMKAIVLALKEFPIFNSTFDEEKEEIVYKQNYHLGIATDTDRGLIVPVLFDVDRKSIIELAQGIEELAELVRDNKFTLEHLRGSTFSITNYGAIGGSFGTPIINYPESAILGIGRIQQKPIVKDGMLAIGHLLPLSLSYDHRMIDGASGVRFMRFLEEALRDPDMLLLRS